MRRRGAGAYHPLADAAAVLAAYGGGTGIALAWELQLLKTAGGA